MLSCRFVSIPQRAIRSRSRRDRSLVGRDRTAEVRIKESSVSRKHATIEHRGAEWVIVDNGSANGTFLDGLQVAEAVLRDGQTLRLGAVSFRVEIEIPPSPTQTLRPRTDPGTSMRRRSRGFPAIQADLPPPAAAARPRRRQRPSAAGGPAPGMTAAQAAEVLGVTAGAPPADVRRQYQRLHNDLQIRMTNTPSPSLKRMYQKNLQELKLACELLAPGTSKRMSATVFAPASIGNVGPGFDVLGLAVDGVGDEVRLERTDGPSTIEEITGVDAELIPRAAEKNVVTVAAEAMLRALGERRGRARVAAQGHPAVGRPRRQRRLVGGGRPCGGGGQRPRSEPAGGDGGRPHRGGDGGRPPPRQHRRLRARRADPGALHRSHRRRPRPHRAPLVGGPGHAGACALETRTARAVLAAALRPRGLGAADGQHGRARCTAFASGDRRSCRGRWRTASPSPGARR